MEIQDVQERSVAPLCTRCGLCCVMLSARIEDDEAVTMAEENDLEVDDFTQIEPEGFGANPGKRVLSMPCYFLFGKPADHVRCAAYTRFRPGVCHSYVCKVALAYRTGVCELEEALSTLRTAYQTGRRDLFNWDGRTEEGALQVASLIPHLRRQAADIFDSLGQPENVDKETLETLLVAEMVTPVYDFSSEFRHFGFNMLMNVHERGALDLTDVLKEDDVKDWDDEQKSFAADVVGLTLDRVRTHFDRSSTVPEKTEEEL